MAKVLHLFVCPVRKTPMIEVQQVLTIAGAGLKGDRYTTGDGSYNHESGIGNRQVSLISSVGFEGTEFSYADSRRNIIIGPGIELPALIGKTFAIGGVRFHGVKYCTTCKVPSDLASKHLLFSRVFHERGGILVDVLDSGSIAVGNELVRL
jgi:hypothetical protein